MILIGLDPGVHTGFAMSENGVLVHVATFKACLAENMVEHHAKGKDAVVYFEDARLRTWFGSKGREALQGAGSIKRDCHRWEEWLEFHGIKFVKVAPKSNKTKLTADQFKRITGWQGKTNEHNRDAAMLIYGLRK